MSAKNSLNFAPRQQHPDPNQDPGPSGSGRPPRRDSTQYDTNNASLDPSNGRELYPSPSGIYTDGRENAPSQSQLGARDNHHQLSNYSSREESRLSTLPSSSSLAGRDEHFASSRLDEPKETRTDFSSFPSDQASGSEPKKTTLSRKGRREKPHIALASNQPPTTQGKPRARVYVACQQCRTRKIRCDGAKPVCHNCGRRAGGHNECNYDPLPKRRGPDKQPGARQRFLQAPESGSPEGPPPRRRRRHDTAAFDIHSTTVHSTTDYSSISPVSPATSRSSIKELIPSTLATPASNAYSPESSGTSTANNYAVSTSIVLGPFPSLEPNDYVDPPMQYLPPNQSANPPYADSCACLGSMRCPHEPTSNFHFKPPQYATNSVASSSYESFDLPEAPVHYSIPQLYTSSEDHAKRTREEAFRIAAQPSLDFTRQIWWDSLLSLYLSPSSTRLLSLDHTQRDAATKNIAADLRFLFRSSNYWFSFFHIPTFFSNFHDSARRQQIQPSLVLAALAVATFFQSSEAGLGVSGRRRALRFRDEAQGALEASFNAGWVDEKLAQAAWLLALFEVCAHPEHSTKRSVSAMLILDSIIRSLSLTLIDAEDPEASVFSPGTVPVVMESPGPIAGHSYDSRPSYTYYLPPTSHTASETGGCSCKSLTQGYRWPASLEHTPMWQATPAWAPSLSEGEIRKESCRRLCWSSMILAAGHTSYATANRGHAATLFISDPSNYALLFSGESTIRSPSISSQSSSKDTIWALYDRAFLLFHSCSKMRDDRSTTNAQKAQFALKAWLEADALEAAMNRHTCDIERNFIFQGREYIFNIRMCITYEFQRYIPLVPVGVSAHRQKAEEWLTHQAIVAQRFMHGLHTITGNSKNILAQRPFFVFWLMGQIQRSLALWECDNTMPVALEVCKAFIPAVDYLSSLWPCSEQRHRHEDIREQIAEACHAAGLPPPPPPSRTIHVPS